MMEAPAATQLESRNTLIVGFPKSKLAIRGMYVKLKIRV